MKTSGKGKIVCCLCMLCCLIVWTATGYAAETEDTVAGFAITVMESEEKNRSRVEYELYQVAVGGADTEIIRTDSFLHYPVSLQNLDAEGWRAAAQTLAAYVKADDIAPLQQSRVGIDGKAVFCDLQAGIYLLMIAACEDNETWVQTVPVLVTLPTQENANGSAILMPKQNPVEVYRKIQVVKVWNDEGCEEQRPEQISIALLKNGTLYDQITITAADNWRYSWDALPGEQAVWQIVEKQVPDGYTVQCVQEQETFILTNFHEALLPDDEQPAIEITEEIVPKGDTKLPQTGQLWWPIMVLAVLGILFFLTGWKKAQEEAQDE